MEGEYAAGAPELALELAISNHSRDLGVKSRLYERMGVREYLIAVVEQEQFHWKALSPDGFQSIDADDDGIVRSRFFPGLWLDPAALWSHDQARLFAVVQQGLGSPEHAAFVARLAVPKS